MDTESCRSLPHPTHPAHRLPSGPPFPPLLALLMKLRPSLEVIALGVPSLTARMAIEYTDHQAAKELARAERLPNSKRAAMSKAFRSREDGDREELHVQA